MENELLKIPCEKFFRFLFFKKGTVLTEKATFFQKDFAPHPSKRIAGNGERVVKNSL